MSVVTVALSGNAENAKRVLHSFACDASLVAGDPVYIDPANDNKVLKPSDNTSVYQVIGVCYDKTTTTLARIILLGVMPGFSGLTGSGRVFLSETGDLTQTKPTNSGYLHNLGVATSETEILIIPNNIRVKMV